MQRIDGRALAGLALVAGGALGLLQNFGLLGGLTGLIWAAIFAAAGALCLAAFLTRPGAWWAAIPGTTLAGLGATIFLSETLGHTADWVGGMFMAAIGLGFALVYLKRRAFWWAIIPAGVLFTIGAVAGLEGAISDEVTGGVFFLGLAMTFAAVALLPEERRTRWALIPAGALLTLAAVATFSTSGLAAYFWPMALILGGIAILIGNARANRSERGA